jgi:hypothetical protein
VAIIVISKRKIINMKKYLGSSLLIILFLVNSELHSISYVWNGSVSGSWNNSLNWTPNSGWPQSSGDMATINSGMPFSPLLAGITTIGSLTINSGASLGLGTYILTTAGPVNFNSATLTTSAGSLNLTGNSNVFVNSSIGVQVAISSIHFQFIGTTFLMPVSVTKTGGVVNSCGGNTFNSTFNLINNSPQVIRFGDTNPDIFNSASSFENQSSGSICLAYNSTGNMFNGNITVASSTTFGSIFNCGIAGGTSTLSNGYTIAEGGTGFLGGTFEMRNFTQLGSAPSLSLDLSIPVCCSSLGLILILGPGNIFNAPVNFIASNILFSGNTFNGATTNLTKTFNGSAFNNVSDGGNVFNSPDTYISNLTSSTLTLAFIAPDDYNGNAHFERGIGGFSSPNFFVAHNGLNTFSGDIEIIGGGAPSTVTILFGAGNGTVLLDGTGTQNIKRVNPGFIPPASVQRLSVNKPSGNVILDTDVNIFTNLTMTNGLVNSFAGKTFVMQNGSSSNLGSTASYVNGPIRYIHANTVAVALNLPIGKGAAYRPAILNTTHTDASSVTYTAEVINSSAQALSYSMPPTINLVSKVRYWQIDRDAIGNLLGAQLSAFYDADDGVTNPANLSLAKTIGAGTSWNDIGGTGSAAVTGSITSTTFTTFGKFALANKIAGTNPLPIELLKFEAFPINKSVILNWQTATEKNNRYFTVERSSEGVLFEEVAVVEAFGNSNELRNYEIVDQTPYENVSYYRLKQTDADGTNKTFKVIAVDITPKNSFEILPNPSDGEFEIVMKNSPKGIIEVMIRDFKGSIVSHEKIILDRNQKTIKFQQHDNLRKGVYFIDVNGETDSYRSKLVIR